MRLPLDLMKVDDIIYLDETEWFLALCKKNHKELNEQGITDEMICKCLQREGKSSLDFHKKKSQAKQMRLF